MRIALVCGNYFWNKFCWELCLLIFWVMALLAVTYWTLPNTLLKLECSKQDWTSINNVCETFRIEAWQPGYFPIWPHRLRTSVCRRWACRSPSHLRSASNGTPVRSNLSFPNFASRLKFKSIRTLWDPIMSISPPTYPFPCSNRPEGLHQGSIVLRAIAGWKLKTVVFLGKKYCFL